MSSVGGAPHRCRLLNICLALGVRLPHVGSHPVRPKTLSLPGSRIPCSLCLENNMTPTLPIPVSATAGRPWWAGRAQPFSAEGPLSGMQSGLWGLCGVGAPGDWSLAQGLFLPTEPGSTCSPPCEEDVRVAAPPRSKHRLGPAQTLGRPNSVPRLAHGERHQEACFPHARSLNHSASADIP